MPDAEDRYYYGLDDLHGALGSTAAVAVLLVAITQTVRQSFPTVMTAPRCVLFTWAMGPLLMLAAWYLHFTPGSLGWREAVALGLSAALQANGGYSVAKATIARPARRRGRGDVPAGEAGFGDGR